MPTVIDTLIVRLGLDTFAYRKGAAEVAATGRELAEDQATSADKAAHAVEKAANEAAAQQEKAAKKAADEQAKAARKAAAEQARAAKAAEAEAKKLERQYEKVRNEILSVTAAAFGAAAIRDFFSSVVSGQSRLASTSKDFSLSARELDAWHKTAQTALGGTAEGFDKSVQSILSGIEAFKAGDASNMVVASLQQLGVKATDASGRMRPMKDILLDLSTAFRKMPNRQDQLLWSQRLGLDEGTLNLLRQGRGAVQNLYDTQYRNSKVTEASAQQAEDTRKAWAELGNTWEDIRNTLFVDLTPAMKVLNSVLRELGKLMEAHPDLTAGLFGTLMAVSTIGGVLKLTGALGGLRTILGAVGRMLGLGGAAGAAGGAAEGAAAAAGGGLLGTLGTAGVLAWLGLQGAKAAGLPDTDVAKGRADVKRGEWLKASADLPLADFVKAVWNHVTGGEKPLADASKAQQDAAHALVDAAKQLANAVSSPAQAADMSSAASNAPASGRSRAAVATFMKMGWSKEQAAGLAANLNIESGLRPNIVGDSGAAYGIGQWHADRQAEFKRVFGHDIRSSTLDEQLQFVHYELTRGREQAAGRALRQAASAGEAGAIVSAKYERPLNVEKEIAKRSTAASALYGSLGASGAGSAGMPTMAPMLAAGNRAAYAGGATVNSNNKTETHIGQITVMASDPKDGAKVGHDLRSDLAQHALIANASYGMT
ncbi:hypothetical protein R75461_07788 [Paraburkholderia nemoris]|uniref:phage tail tip lysozyme n=1 Tax=Paraburkholderia nemoris TaxID=2793076 RepID=UPI001909800C|nr:MULTISPECIES: phage tail tip lysozyme [Paraburkholderia]MBK3786513.1 hypothetical protein [Paraburkholderia aspalathi]CAE6857361.1 hypothetical protein R75461_07788 [Paraburkholderia nemoris]